MTLRAFVAIELPPPTRAALAGACDAFRRVAPDWEADKWVAEENLHVTLKFIGPLREQDTQRAVGAITAACSRHAPFELTLSGVVPRSAGRRTSMLWATMSAGAERFAALASDVDAALAETLGTPVDERAPHAHVTLVRARRPHRVPPDALADAVAALTSAGPASTVVSVACATLFESRLGRTGPTYEMLGSVPLAGD